MEALPPCLVIHECKNQPPLVDLRIITLGWLVMYVPSARVSFEIGLQHLLEEKPSEAAALGETSLVSSESLIELV